MSKIPHRELIFEGKREAFFLCLEAQESRRLTPVFHRLPFVFFSFLSASAGLGLYIIHIKMVKHT